MKLYLVDGYGFVFRAFHSMPPLSRADGLPIGAVYGFTNMLFKFLASHEADMLAVVLDAGQKTFRHDIFPEYKSNRPEPPQELILQFPIIRDVVEAFNVKVLEKPGFEADDLIATYAKLAKSQGIEVKIVSSDKDLMQLIEEGISMYDAMKDKNIADAEVIAKFGVRPNQVLDILSLIGDSSDHIPGVKGIGIKTAAELINEFGSLDGIYQSLDKIKQERRRQMLVEGKEKAYLSKQLISLDEKVELDVSLDDLKVKELDKTKLADFLAQQGFKNLLAKIGAHNTHVEKKENTLVSREIKSLDEIKKLNKDIENAGELGLFYDGEKLELSFGDNNYYVKLSPERIQETLFDMPSEDECLLPNVLQVLSGVLADESIRKITINAKDLLKKVTLKAYDDIAIMSYALDTGKHKYALKELTKIYLGEDAVPSAYGIRQIYKIIYNQLVQNKILSLYENLEKKMIGCLAQIEAKGVKIDLEYLRNLAKEFHAKVADIAGRIYKIAGREFNIGSPKQLGEVLFQDLGIKLEQKSKTGKLSTGVEVLDLLEEQGHEIAGLIIEWRQYSKLLSTYIEALPKCVNPKTGRVHTNFVMTATTTGRLSSIDPNLQNIPIRTDEGHRIREAFIAEPGNILISADYSQIELRLLAHTANMKQLQDAFINGDDIHAITASQMFGVPVDKVDSNLRRQAKTINFGIIYGISAFGLAKRLNISRGDAKNYIDAYFKQYPGIKEFMDSAIHYARNNGYIKTLFGRRCYVNGINDKNFAVRGNAERAAINAPLQGTAADIIKKAMVSLPDDVKQYMTLQIHDELLFEVPEAKVEEVSKKIKSTMENVIKLNVPLSVDVGSGKNWAKAH
jgi:DNA polymerase-1